jgi:hypothetical protein
MNIALVKSLIRHPWLNIKFTLKQWLSKTDVRRWSRSESLRSDWDERTRLMAQFIRPSSSVIEFGAGRQVLRTYIPQDCRYQPSDVADRGNGTMVCDLNQSFPSLSGIYDYAVFSGVLEYIEDVDRLLKNLAPHTQTILASYADVGGVPDLLTRKMCGWINHYTEQEFVDYFLSNGFVLREKTTWTVQRVYVFVRAQ